MMKKLFIKAYYKHAIKNSGASLLIIECKDEAVKLTGLAERVVISMTKDSAILKKIIGKYGLDKEVESNLSHKELRNTTHPTGSVARAGQRKIVFVENGKITIKT
jgi:hypothetical protein